MTHGITGHTGSIIVATDEFSGNKAADFVAMAVEIDAEIGTELGTEGGKLRTGAVGRPFKAGCAFKGSEKAFCLTVISKTDPREVNFETIENSIGQFVGVRSRDAVVGIAVGIAEVKEFV
ncbi:unknown [Prevotella sp. CAG:755]|nr:unknown [Prevotella sp. CAG:755]